MKEQVSESEFIARFNQMNRENNFSYDGRRALFEYLTQLEEDTGEEITLDVIAICCDYNEYKDIAEFMGDYNQYEPQQEEEDEDEFKQRLEEEISDNTTLIKLSDDLNDGFIIQAY